MTLSKRLWKLPKSTSNKQNIYNIYNNRVKLNRDIHFTCIRRLLNNTCVKHNFKSVHVSNLFCSAKEICKYPSFSKVDGNYPLDLEISGALLSEKMEVNKENHILLFWEFQKSSKFWMVIFFSMTVFSPYTAIFWFKAMPLTTLQIKNLLALTFIGYTSENDNIVF